MEKLKRSRGELPEMTINMPSSMGGTSFLQKMATMVGIGDGQLDIVKQNKRHDALLHIPTPTDDEDEADGDGEVNEMEAEENRPPDEQEAAIAAIDMDMLDALPDDLRENFLDLLSDPEEFML